MRNRVGNRLRASLIVLLTVFSLSSTMVPTTALDLGAKAKYIISVTPSAKAAIEATVIKNGWKIDSKYNYVFDGYTVELPKIVAGLLAKIPNVLTVEEDMPVSGLAIQNTQSPTPAWGMDRVDQREKVGLTGSIGMGKSTVANMFKNYGFPVFDADKVVHDLYKKGGAAINTIKNFYPEAVINNTVNREILRSFIVENPDKIGELESLIHPLVGAERDGFLKTNKNKEILVFDVPLLFETGLNKIMDIVVVVSAPYHIQYERVLSREGMTEKIFKGLLAKQLSDDAKKSKADIVIKTDDSLKTTNNQVKEFISSLGIKVN